MDEARVGPFSVVSVIDASGVLAVTGPEAFPSASEADWAAARLLDPEAFGPDLRWALDFRCVAIRRPDGRVTLVDVGIGAEGSPAGWAPLPGRLVAALGEVGIAVGDVDTVVLTHLHEDHCGGVVDGSGSPVFPDARHVVQAVEIASLRAEPDLTIWSYAVEPLLAAGLLDEVDGRVALTLRSHGRPHARPHGRPPVGGRDRGRRRGHRDRRRAGSCGPAGQPRRRLPVGGRPGGGCGHATDGCSTTREPAVPGWPRRTCTRPSSRLVVRTRCSRRRRRGRNR